MIPPQGLEIRWQGVVALAVIAAAIVLTLVYVEDGTTAVLATVAAVAGLLPSPAAAARVP